jgi:hypothetical protein
MPFDSVRVRVKDGSPLKTFLRLSNVGVPLAKWEGLEFPGASARGTLRRTIRAASA